MLIPLKEDEVKEYINKVYKLGLDLSKSSYPTYKDKIKTKDDFIKKTYSSFNKMNGEVLLFKDNKSSKVEGYIKYYFIKEDNYISVDIFNISKHYSFALDEFINYVTLKYKGYDLYLGYSIKNKDAINYLSSNENGFSLLDTLEHNIIKLNKYKMVKESPYVNIVDRSNFNEFKELHDKSISSNTYWNSTRIKEDLSNWLIFNRYDFNNNIVASIYVRNVNLMYEVFGIDYVNNEFNNTSFRELMGSVLNFIKKIGVEHLVYFGNRNEQSILDRLGFKHFDTYQSFYKTL